MSKTTFIVLNENTFGYTEGGTQSPFCRMYVMSVDYLHGGDPMNLDKIIIARKEKCRIATTNDFEHFRISVDGYLKRGEDYVFIR